MVTIVNNSALAASYKMGKYINFKCVQGQTMRQRFSIRFFFTKVVAGAEEIIRAHHYHQIQRTFKVWFQKLNQKVILELPYYSAIPFLGIYLEEIKEYLKNLKKISALLCSWQCNLQ